MAITLWPSTNHDALVNAIRDANSDNKRIDLKPGIHLTKPGHGRQISINENGLHIKGKLVTGEYSSIQRPDHAIEDIEHPDSNYGLFFIPSAPTGEEWESVSSWKDSTITDPDTNITTPYKYAVITRGAIKIENLELDCNMGNQCLPDTIPAEKIEHSAMLAFSGQKYESSSFPGKVIYVAFESVTLNNIRTTRGGYADDIWISRGYFRPNIGEVSIKKITSQNRINKRRSTIDFSGLAQHVEIENANIISLQVEATSGRWEDLPGDKLNETNHYSYWKLKNIVCETFDLGAKGKDIFLAAQNIESTKSTHLYQIGGVIRNCIFNMLPKPTTLNRLNALTFRQVTWMFSAHRTEDGRFIGLAIRPQFGEPCSATFIQNTFRVRDEVTKISEDDRFFLIETENTPLPAGNAVNLEFRNCSYDNRFGKDNPPQMYIAKVHARGKWKFTKADFMGLPVNRALLIKGTASISAGGSNVIINIP